MGARILSGKPIADAILAEARSRAKELKLTPSLHIIKTSRSRAQELFVRMKVRACNHVGAKVTVHEFNSSSEAELISLIERLNKDRDVHGVVVQLPLPDGMSTLNVMEALDVEKDVDGLHPLNLGRLLAGRESRPTATAFAVVKLLEAYGIDVEGSDVVVVNNSLLVGRPLFAMLTQRMATVQVCHVKTKGLREKTLRADILISATGVPRIITGDMVAEGSVVIDVGTGFVDGSLVGDIDVQSVSEKASALSPVPGGVGPVTVATLISNLINCAAEFSAGG